MCERCKIGGHRLCVAKSIRKNYPNSYADTFVAGNLIEEAEAEHAQCKHPGTCPCQHRLTLEATQAAPQGT